jgi:hypothetical protein
MKELKTYIKEAYKFFEVNHPNLCVTSEEIADCVCDFIEDDFGIELDQNEYDKILKEIEGK